MMLLWTQTKQFRRSQDGAALVEFGLLLPVFLLMFAMAVEGSRTFWAYQTTISGVRDAARFVARSASVSLCEEGGTLNNYTEKVTEIVSKTVDGDNLFPSTITVARVTPKLDCVSGNFAIGTVPMAHVTATLDIQYPFSGVFDWVGISLSTISTTVSDHSRIYGV